MLKSNLPPFSGTYSFVSEMSCDVNWIKIQNLLKARNEVGVKKGKQDSECFSKTKESRKNNCGDLRRKRSLEQSESFNSNEPNFPKLSSTAFLKVNKGLYV